ncbi:MAG TPA: cation transporter [Thermococcaceae archaeon]|uniref:Cobalt/zinc/cadmium cation efflux pump protein n=2 Tax=Thermococcus sibiricus TaxID=172049 RepID=C6A3K3_THESM|nr:cation diffusion facilitator family transporter [Thermococcus sibiricus]ACS90198.1 Cobalt/zinc/cadmium cation efflux pump protein [Thermococcus sibiricus MM 739]KUK18169.1 MAG: Cobalt/zinc/cadmium cation efflux pump protein [Thermococcus sibiricus]KUK29211.1 MAG: Cobalt/zinc/cadmium cation efflux pump protein [Thermococcus sp. 40_45]HII68101.1 cation transporter [Thermococcaceae archaeon]
MEIIYRPLIVSIFGNIVLAIVKITVGVLYSSLALISDGVHSLSDVITSIFGYFGAKIASKPADQTHPFGHSRFESFFAFFIGMALFLVAYEIGKDAIKRIFGDSTIEVNAIMIGVVLLSIFSKEAMTQYSLKVGRRLNNQILIADAYHHRSDALSSVAVLVGLGLQRFGFRYGDALASVVVVILIGKVAVEIVLKNVGYLTGTSAPHEILEEIKNAALSVTGVVDVHDLRAHYVGPRLHVELHIEVPPELTLKEAHDISETVKKRIERLEEVELAFVHVDIKGITE